ncbi:hypothetical protein [Photobacterium leiognathi]|uniref:hypothetical protein n=1 Tax=Photobacterium leiognathi TaxID=553611 RepID=UPI002737051C|nr:hypothetical protein [Photobacterium leiognathi]
MKNIKTDKDVINDVWVIAITPNKIIFTDKKPSNNDFIMYSLPREAFLSEVLIKN